jgi:class 3 adenylate cyclase
VSVSVEFATILLTDLVGSTEREIMVGPSRADELRAQHFALLREAIEWSGGREVKTTGDGLMVAFRSVSAGVRCAVTMQQLSERRSRHAEQPVHIRIGLGAGETTLQDGDFFGTAPIEAARLCREAPPDGILVSVAVRMLADRSENVEFRSIGELELKGFPQPVEAFAVLWQPLPDESGRVAGGWPLPLELAAPRGTYVGRKAKCAQIEQAQAAARSGSRRVVLLSGEPGIGKTRLAAYAATVAHGDGFAVLWGSCSEELAVPYEPWIGVCTQLVEHIPDDMLDRCVERFGGEVARLARNLPRRVPEAAAPQSSDPETERFLLFAAVAGMLRTASGSRPMCVVLDDLHSADGQTIALLKHVVRTVAQDPLLVIVTYRDSELTKDHPLTAALADLHQIDGVQRLPLDGLYVDEVSELMSAAAGHELDQDGRALASEITSQTGGNPFFVGEILRSLVESEMLVFDEGTGRWKTGRSTAMRLPQSVRDVIERRAQRLGDEVRELLVPAAVIGNSFDVELLSELVDIGEGVVLDRLEAAVAASLLVESTDRIGRFSFVHALINECLYEGLGATRRAKLHHRVALALETVGAGQDEERLGELAMHWRLATAPVASHKAADYARRAGQRALESLAPAEAARLFRDAVELSGETDSLERCQALIGRGEAQRQIGDGEYRQTLLEASRIAYQLGNAQLAAEAALANSSGTYSVIGEVDAARLQAIEQAIEIDDPPSPARRARLLALEALELGWDPDVRQRRALVDEAVRLARASRDARVLASVLRNAVLASTSSDTLELRTELAKELAHSAEVAEDPALEFWAHVVQFNVMVEKCESAAAEVALQRMEACARGLGQPLLSWNAAYGRAGWFLPRGHLVAAEQLAEHASQVGQQAGEPNALLIHGSQLTCLRAYQGRADEVIPTLEQIVTAYPHVSGWDAGLASCYCLAGRHEEAAVIVRRAASDRFEHVYWDQGRTTALALYADAAYECKLRPEAEILYDLIEPWHDQVAWNGASMFGHGSMWLALLAATLGWDDRADEHFNVACTVQEANGVLLWATRAYLGWAQSLAVRGDETGASARAARALELAREYGYGAFEARAAAILGVKSLPEGLSARQHEATATN